MIKTPINITVDHCGEGCMLYHHDGSFGYCHHPQADSNEALTELNAYGGIYAVYVDGRWSDRACEEAPLGKNCPIPPQCKMRDVPVLVSLQPTPKAR